MLTKITTKRLVVGVLTGVSIIAAAVVVAAWTSGGSGEGYAKAGTAQALSTLDASAATSATLYPGVTGDVTLTISNPNPYPVQVTAVSLNGTNANITADAGHSGCTTTGVSFTNQTGLTITVPAESGGTAGQVTATLTGAVSMSNASLNACQGATFTIPVTLSGASSA